MSRKDKIDFRVRDEKSKGNIPLCFKEIKKCDETTLHALILKTKNSFSLKWKSASIKFFCFTCSVSLYLRKKTR